jgi:uncharacterized protein (TIGR04222 family)
MNAKHNELLQKLEQFQLDSPEASLPFSARLARENQWSPAYTARVIAEYKRFTFLSVAAGHPVSPSEDVDQAWHLHLTYSENYWKHFCPTVLGQPLHHQPTRGGANEREKFHDWYSQTLASYARCFGEPPPPDIWPAPESRLNEKHNFIRVDRERHWVIPKIRFPVKSLWLARLALAALAIAGTGAMLASDADPFDWRGPDFLWFYVILYSAALTVAIVWRRALRLPGGQDSASAPELDAYAIACLNGGRILAANTAIANLIRQNLLRLDAKAKRLYSLIPKLKPEFPHELERLVYNAADSSDGATIANVREAAKPWLAPASDDLKSRGLLVSDSQARKAALLPLLLPLAAVAIGVIKIFVGVHRDKPVGYLIGFCIASFFISFIILARRPLRSRRGDAFLRRLQERYVGPRRVSANTTAITTAEFATIVGLFGMTALAGSELSSLRRSLMPPNGGNSCGSSCGGGCGGGGCGGGGCGGCGGGGD